MTDTDIGSGQEYSPLVAAVNGLAIEQARSTGIIETRINGLEKTISELSRLFSEVSGLKTLVEVLRTQQDALRAQVTENKTNVALVQTNVATHNEIARDYADWRKETEGTIKELAAKDVAQDQMLIKLSIGLSIGIFILQLVVTVWLAPLLERLFK